MTYSYTVRKLRDVIVTAAVIACVTVAGLPARDLSSAGRSRLIRADLSRETGPHSRAALMVVGAGRANEGLRADWQAQLAQTQR